MVDLKRLIWSYLTSDVTLVGLVGGATHIKVASQVDRIPAKGVTIQPSDSGKLIPEVHSILTSRYLIVAWSNVGDEDCERIGERLFALLDGEISSDSNVFVYDSDASRLTGPYWDGETKCWREDIDLALIARNL